MTWSPEIPPRSSASGGSPTPIDDSRTDVVVGVKVLLVSSTLDDDGGLPVCVGRLGTALAEAGHDVTIVGQGSGELCTAIVDARRTVGVELVAVRRAWSVIAQLAAARDVSAAVTAWLARSRGGGPRVVHTHGVWTPTIVAAAETALARGATLVISPHGMLRRAALTRSRLLKRLAWAGAVRRQIVSAAAVHATSTPEAADLGRLVGPGLRACLIPWGIDASRAPPPEVTPPVRRVAACYGRLLPIKGVDLLIDAWQAARPEGWVLRLAGPCDPAMRTRLESRIERWALGNVISIEPPFRRGDLPRMLADVSLAIVPSRSENFSLAVGEALAAGVPVLTTTETAWDSVVEQGCGWCVPPDADSLAAAIVAAAALGPEALTAMGRRGAHWVAREFAWPEIARRFVSGLYLSGA